MQNVFFELGLVIIIATSIAYIAKLMKQPLIPAYILTGIIIGPVFSLITDKSIIAIYSEIGIAFLLFMVGLEIDIKKLSDVGLISTLGGAIQILALFVAGFIAALAFSFVITEAVYIGLIIALSSTMIVVKILSDKGEIDTLHGRIIIGILLLQDIAAIFALSMLATIGSFSILFFIGSILKGIFILLIAYAVSRHAFPPLFKFAAKSKQLLFLLSISVCFLFAIALNQFAGFSIAIGAFVAGVALANLPYNIEIISRIKPLRDFFSIMFFVSLGLGLSISTLNNIWMPLIAFIIIAIILKPIVILFLCSFFGYKKRTGFTTAILLAQISEFSLIIVAQGLEMGHVSQKIFTITILLAVITIAITSYIGKYEDKIYRKFSKKIAFLDKFSEAQEEFEYIPKKEKHDVIICGYNRIGYSIVTTLKKLKKQMIIIDFNPEVIKKLIKQGIPCIYGDIGDLDMIERMDLKNAKMVISTVPTLADNMLLIKKVREANKKAIILITANQINEALQFYDAGADYVIMPHFLGGDHASLLIEDFHKNINKVIDIKLKHIQELRRRQEIGHEHPKHH